MATPQRGEVWLVDLDPVRGHGQAGKRPCLIASADPFNASPADLVIAIPLTTRAKGIPSHVEVAPPEAGLQVRSFIKCEDIRSLSKGRLERRWGTVSATTLAEVERRLRLLLDL